MSARDKLPDEEADADDDRRNEEHQNQPDHARGRTHQVLFDAAADVEGRIAHGFSDEDPAQNDTGMDPSAQQDDRGYGDDGAQDIADDDFGRTVNGNREPLALGGEGLKAT